MINCIDKCLQQNQKGSKLYFKRSKKGVTVIVNVDI